MTRTLKIRLWEEYKISCHDAWWDRGGAVLTFRDATDPNERAKRIAEKTGCDVIHLYGNQLLIDGFA